MQHRDHHRSSCGPNIRIITWFRLNCLACGLTIAEPLMIELLKGFPDYIALLLAGARHEGRLRNFC